MKLITYEIPSEINYSGGYATYRNLYNHAYTKMLNLFERNSLSDQTFCFLPKHWAVIVSNVLEKMLDIDSKLKFCRIFEKYGKLNIEIVPNDNSKETLLELSDIKHEAQNRIDNIVHGLVHKRILDTKTEGKTEWLMSINLLNIIH